MLLALNRLSCKMDKIIKLMLYREECDAAFLAVRPIF
jgi:hypothetical protein